MGKWLTAECPVRIDVSGGWSDTPPITYEHGGAVTMVALLVNGKVCISYKIVNLCVTCIYKSNKPFACS